MKSFNNNNNNNPRSNSNNNKLREKLAFLEGSVREELEPF
jgi:hypothetical protein